MRVRWAANAQYEQVFFACVRYGMLGLSWYADQRVLFYWFFLGVQLYGSSASCYVIKLCRGYVNVLESLLSGVYGCQGDAERNVFGQLL